MLQLLNSALISLWLEAAGIIEPPAPQTIQVWDLLVLDHPDPGVQTLLDTYLTTLADQGFAAQDQGIWLQTTTTLLTQNRGDQPLPGASLTKVATSLAALKTWGPHHRFVTEVQATGPVSQGTLQGDLILQGSGEALFSWPSAIRLGNLLNQLGIQRVTGNLVLEGPFDVNLNGESHQGGQLLRQGFNHRLWPTDAQIQYAKLPQKPPPPQVNIEGEVTLVPQAPPIAVLGQHQSAPLYQVLQQMNIHSSNEMAEMLAQSLGGATTVVQTAAATAAVPVTELRLQNGSGLGQENQLSPRAVAGMFQAIQQVLQPHQLTLLDVFPMSGRDLGTLEDRHIPTAAVVKTGTLWDVSALAGMIPTQQHGPVWFTIMNRGDNVEGFRQAQDRFLQALRQRWGAPTLLPIQEQSP